MTEETKEKRSLTHAAIMLGTYLICVSIVVYYYLVEYHNYEHDRESKIIWTLLTFPTWCLCKIAAHIMVLFAVLGMGLTPGGIGFIIYTCFYVTLCYGPYLLLFRHALKPKNKWLMYLFIAWSIANVIGFYYTTG